MARKTFRNKITTPEIIEKIHPVNKKLQKQFLREKDTRCADGTIEGYDSDLDIFFCWNYLYNDNKLFTDIKKIEFSEFFSFIIEEMKVGSARFSHLRSALSMLSNFIVKFHDETYPDFRNVILQVIEAMPKIAVREKTVFTEAQVDSLKEFILEVLGSKQQLCLLMLFISSGVRISEAFRFTKSIIDENNLAFDNLFLETTKPIKTKGRTKTGLVIKKFIVKDLFLPYYKDWIEERNQILKDKGIEDHDFIFIKADGSPATDDYSRTWISKWDDFMSVAVYPHAFRHYTVSYLTRLGLSSDFIVEIFGWKTSTMFHVYNDVEAKEREWKDLYKLKDKMENDKIE
ncbi:MAG: integrase [Dehalococcoidia bacterium]|nr:MAG: integrase [Dehalococcoidia bacterium]